MTPIIFQNEVFLDCSKAPKSSECTFQFKGKEIYLKHTLDRGFKKFIHRIYCEVDGQNYSFGYYRYHPGYGNFGNWPIIEIEGNQYRFRIDWPLEEGTKAIRLEPEENNKSEEEIKAPINQEELDDIEGFLHIHTLPPDRRKQIIEQLKKNKE